jgi:hypothetical protein
VFPVFFRPEKERANCHEANMANILIGLKKIKTWKRKQMKTFVSETGKGNGRK